MRMATLRPILPIDEILKKLEDLGKTEDPVIKPIDRKPEDLGEVEHPTEGTEGVESRSLGRTTNPNDSQEEMTDGGESQKERAETWKGFVDFVRSRNPVLGSFLVLGNLVHVNDEKIEIGFEKDSFHYERMIERENRNQLEAICQDHFQRKIKVIISSFDQGGGLKKRVVSESGDMSQNPLVQEALRLFDGRIVED